MENLQTAFLLMVVGMTTVFLILLIVIYMGKGLISLVNTYAPEEVAPPKKRTSIATPAIPQDTLAVIATAVQLVTNGKGSVSKVEKI